MTKSKGTPNRSILIGVILVVVIAVAGVAVWMNFFNNSPAEIKGLQYDNPQTAADFTLTDQHGNPVSLSDYRGKVVMMYFGFTNCPDQCPLTMAIWNQVQAKLGSKSDDVQFLFVTIDPLRDSPEQIADYLSHYSADITGLTGTLEEIEDVATDYSVFFETIDIPETEGAESDSMADTDTEQNDTAEDDHDHADSDDHDHADSDDHDHADSDDHDHAVESEDDHDHADSDDHTDTSQPHDHEEELAMYDYWVNHTALTFVIDKEGKLVLAFPYLTSADDIVSDLENWLN